MYKFDHIYYVRHLSTRFLLLYRLIICVPFPFQTLHFKYKCCIQWFAAIHGSKVDSAFHPSEVDQKSASNFGELSGKK